MIGTFDRMRERRINWRRELPPVLVVAGLAADYLSPPALWTMLLPFGAVVMLMALRKWWHAAAVFGLCSWILIPVAAGTFLRFDPGTTRQPVAGPDGLTMIAIGARRGSYEPRGPF